ncbi:hypothetical protein GALMADRAFT_159992 [Galerina marginata CBS 339.88]|uniref:F-box domain-containing protein n=1 Tax=Galerina marginata (strain CBS 339.88) TaxID=685588 RepID=A0A067STS6_GALM3|nr:hypothetical protein GALMADRAFT_159992 [Galerina marginata CBS 339.88]
MAPSFTDNTRVLPQELINLILDKLAFQMPDEESLYTLRACSLVSRSFHSESRRHIFSEIEFIIDENTQKRASKLRSVLKYKNAELASVTRTLKLVLPFHVAMGGAQNNSTRSTFLMKLGVKENGWLKLVDVLKSSNLESLTVAVRARSSYQQLVNIYMDPGFFQICSKHNLKSLRLVNIGNVPASLIIEAFSSFYLSNLELCNISITAQDESSRSLSDQHSKNILSKINRLEMRRVLCLVPSQVSALFKCLNFPLLQTLVVSVPCYPEAAKELWDFIQGVAPTLATLELECGARPVVGFFPTEFVWLSNLGSLRKLKFAARSYSTGDLSSQLRLLNDLISSITAPVGIESIDFHFTIQSYAGYPVRQHRNDRIPEATWKADPGWAPLDRLLIGEMLVNLRTINLNVEFFYHDPKLLKARHIAAGPNSSRDARAILPVTSTSPSIALSLDISTVCSPQSMEASLYID